MLRSFKMKHMKSSDSVKQTMATLSDLHRPLEEHWMGARTKFPLDPNNSDLLYKHHMAKLEEIYLHQNTYKAEPTQELRAMTPVSQLYGINGLYTSNNPAREERMKDKEYGWVSNMHRDFSGEDEGKASTRPISRGSDYCRAPSCTGLTPHTRNNERTSTARSFGAPSPSSTTAGSRFEPLYKPRELSTNLDSTNRSTLTSGSSMNQSQSRPSSSGAMRESHNHQHSHSHTITGSRTRSRSGVAHDDMKQDQKIKGEYFQQMHQPALISIVNSDPNSRGRCTVDEDHLTGEDLIMLGLYRLNDEQAAIYSDFVEMISGLDKHDACKVVEDAIKDSQRIESSSGGGADLMSLYGGTELPTEDYESTMEVEHEV